jgi:cysteine-rich repeat protein
VQDIVVCSNDAGTVINRGTLPNRTTLAWQLVYSIARKSNNWYIDWSAASYNYTLLDRSYLTKSYTNKPNFSSTPILQDNECFNIYVDYCWDWVLDSTHWETCDDGNNIDWDGCSATCQWISPSIQIDKTDANPADLDWIVWNDTQRVNVWTQAVFRIRGTNNFTESLRNIVFTDTVAPNCSWSVTLPGTFPSTWSWVTVSWSWDHTNAILEVWEYIDYTCNWVNTVAGYTNSATVNWIWVTSGLPVTDTDTTVVTIPGWSWWSQPDCVRIELSQSGATANNTYPIWTDVWVTCIWSANTEIVKVECWDWTTATQNNTGIWNFTCKFNSPATFNPKCYVWNGATSWIPNVTSPTCSIKLSSWWGGGWGGGGGHSWFCWDWVIQRPNNQWVNEVCEASLVGWILKFPSWCVDCKTLNFTYPWEWWIILTYPGWWNILFRPYWQVIIWAWSNPFTVFGSTPYIWNDSGEELYLDYPLCVYNSDSSVLLNSDNTWFTGICSAQKIWWLRPWISKTFESLNGWSTINIKWLKITDSTSYKDTILKTTLQWFPDAFFSTPLKVRVSKPAVATVWGWTSLIKNSKITADINKVASDWYSDEDKNKNFVWAWVSTGSISSYSKKVSDTTSVTKISSWQTSKIESNLTKVTTTQVTWNKNITDTLTKYNGLSNVFIVKWNLTINSTSIPWSSERTYIVEWWNLYINQNITYTDNIAFVVKWWNIIIASNVTKINWTLISIKVSGVWWQIISVESDNKLVINWSLYGDIENLVNNRTYIENKNDLINVWTIVSFGSNLFRKQAPLVWDFIWEYIASKKVAK